MLEKRIADLAALEHNLAETRTALTGTGADLVARDGELAQERATLARVEALLAAREADLAGQREDNDGLRVSQVESRTQIMVLEGRRDELSKQLSSVEATLAQTLSALKAMNVDRDSERLRADTLGARAAQAEAGLAAAAAAGTQAATETAGLRRELAHAAQSAQEMAAARAAADERLAAAQEATAAANERNRKEIAAMHDDLHEREQRLETLHAEIQTLQGALTQARADRLRLKRELKQTGKAAAGADASAAAVPDAGNAALRQEIVKVAERLMSLPPNREAAE